MDFREVILLNRILIVMFAVILFYIPVEVYVNGFMMIPAVLIMLALALLTLLFHYFRLFNLAHFYLYMVGNLFILCMGVIVGRGIGNHVIFIPIVLLSIILFRRNITRITLFLITASLFILQQKLFDVVEPQVVISAEVKPLFAVIFFMLALIFTFIIGIYFMAVNKEYEGIILLQKENMELKNKEITDSITYAKRIQTAILPTDNMVKKFLGESFVLYLPKDVVAGDFYWLEITKDTVLFAVADCTGHGVPGAMMSVVCHNALNRSVREEGLTDPGKILDRTREIIIQELGKSNEDVKDGMDISFCALNKETLVLKWAGANNPLWYVRNAVLIEIKPDKQPIGQYLNSNPFNTHTIKLVQNDILYISTDGYQDQFGGEKGKKFKASNLKQLLLRIHSKSPEEQKKIIQRDFVSWKGTNEQVDDVCIIGVKI